MKKAILRLAIVLGLLIASVGVGALVGYASSMVVLMLGLHDYGEYIMCGVFIVSTIAIFASNISRIDYLTTHKLKEPEVKQRDYFKDGNLTRK